MSKAYSWDKKIALIIGSNYYFKAIILKKLRIKKKLFKGKAESYSLAADFSFTKLL